MSAEKRATEHAHCPTPGIHKRTEMFLRDFLGIPRLPLGGTKPSCRSETGGWYMCSTWLTQTHVVRARPTTPFLYQPHLLRMWTRRCPRHRRGEARGEIRRRARDQAGLASRTRGGPDAQRRRSCRGFCGVVENGDREPSPTGHDVRPVQESGSGHPGVLPCRGPQPAR